MNARILAAAGIAASVLVVASGCAHRKLPGTQIDETEDTKAILDVMNKYRTSFEAKDAEGIVKLLSRDFQEDGGSAHLDDDYDYKTVEPKLRANFARMENVKLDFDVRSIEVQDGTATAVYYWSIRYDAPSLTDKRSTNSDIKKMMFKLENEQWKITGGI